VVRRESTRSPRAISESPSTRRRWRGFCLRLFNGPPCPRLVQAARRSCLCSTAAVSLHLMRTGSGELRTPGEVDPVSDRRECRRFFQPSRAPRAPPLLPRGTMTRGAEQNLRFGSFEVKRRRFKTAWLVRIAAMRCYSRSASPDRSGFPVMFPLVYSREPSSVAHQERHRTRPRTACSASSTPPHPGSCFKIEVEHTVG
jgi:hypothetical protein